MKAPAKSGSAPPAGAAKASPAAGAPPQARATRAWTSLSTQVRSVPGGAREARTPAPATGLDAKVRRALDAPGQPLEPSRRAYFERGLGADFTAVRVHSDAAAAAAADALHARAFTVGHHIVLGPAASLASPRGDRLLAHELAHVVQQAGVTPDLDAVNTGAPQVGRIGDVFEREADRAAAAVARGRRGHVRRAPGDAPVLQKLDLAISDFDATDIPAQTALADSDYIDNGLIDGKLRSNGSIFSPVFLGFTLFYADGSIVDIPAAGNSAFPVFSAPTAPVMTIFRRHAPTGKILPITVLQSDFLAASGNTVKEMEDNALATSAKYLLYKKLAGNIDTLFTNALFTTATAYSGLLAQMWNAGLGARGAIQIFTLSGAMRAMAAGRAVTGAAGVAGRTGTGQVTTQAVAAIVKNVLKTGTLTAAERATVAAVEARLTAIVQRAIGNVNAGTATGPWAQRLAGMQTTNPMYRLTLGNAIHEEAFELVQQEVNAGTLNAGIQTNVGRAIPGVGLNNSFGRLRPDIRLPLGNGNEAIWDITTQAQAGHAQPYTNNSWVQYVVELLY